MTGPDFSIFSVSIIEDSVIGCRQITVSPYFRATIMKKLALIPMLALALLPAMEALAQPGRPAVPPTTSPRPAANKPKPKEILPAVQIFFDVNKDVIKKAEFEKLDKLFEDLKTKSDFTVLLTGHTDSTGDPKFNLDLSERRVSNVYDYLADKGLDENVMEKAFFGAAKPREQNSDEDKRMKNRRVEITIFYKEKPKPEPPKPVADTCKGDTTISMGNGVMMRMNICTWKTFMAGNKKGIKVDLTQGVSDIMNSEYPLRNAKYQNLLMAGILKISTPGDSCLAQKATVILPLEAECYKKAKISLFETKTKNYWEPNKNTRPNILKDKTSVKVEIPVTCSGVVACAGVYTGKNRTKFKTSDLNITELYVASECPTMLIPARKVGSSWEIMYDKLNGEAKVYAKTEDGTTFQIQGAELRNLKHGFTLSKPKQNRVFKKYKLSSKSLGMND